jgi:ribosomal protein S18 acetylase RimI-like enzyme
LKIRQALLSDILELARIHQETFDDSHFTKYFPTQLLKNYFSILIESMLYKIVSIDDQGKVNGYLFADFSPSIVINNFFKNNFYNVFIVIVKNPRFIKEKIVEFISRVNKDEAEINQLSIYLIASDQNMKGKGIATSMLKYFENELRISGIKKYSLSVRLNNESAIRFYSNYGFQEKFKNEKSIKFEMSLD